MSAALRAAVRAFHQRPALSFGVVALFALAVGLAGGLWATVDATLLRPLPYPAPDQLVTVMEQHPDRGEMAVTPASFLDWSAPSSAFDSVGGAYLLDLSFAVGELPVRVSGAAVTDGYFAAWQVPAALGRTLSADDFASGQAVVIDHAVWLEHFGGRPDVVGAPVRIDGRPCTVVGVMPAAFRAPGNLQAWVPWVFSPDQRRDRRSHLVGVVARLRSGASRDAAAGELEAFYAGLRRTHAVMDGWTPLVRPLRAVLLGDVSRPLALMGAAVGCLVAVAWVNLVGLLAASWPARRREIAVRLTLGASVRQVVTPLVVEIAVWAGAGAAAGLGIAHLVIAVFAAWLPALDRFAFLPRIDARLLGAVSLFLTLSLLAIALGPLLAFVRRETDLSPRPHGPAGSRLRALTTAAQVCGSVALLGLALTLALALHRLEAVAGADDGRLAIDVGLPELDTADESRHRAFFAALLDAVGTRPEIARVGAASYVPPTPPLGSYRFDVVGQTADGSLRAAVTSAVGGDAFELLGIAAVSGRGLSDRDGDSAPLAAVVSEAFVRRYLAGDPLGQQLRLAGVDSPLTIVGVVADVPQPLAADARIEALLYVPFRQVPWPFMTLLVEPRGDAAAAVRALREEVRRLAPDQATGEVRRLHGLRSRWLDPARSRGGLAGLFAVSAIVVTLLGLHAAVARDVAARRREFAIRQALGATAARLIGRLTLHAATTTAVGAAAGAVLLATILTPLAGHSADVPALDPAAIAAVAAAVVALAALTALGPARRAAEADPSRSLRVE
jgi:putative ABC transport system permease protein